MISGIAPMFEPTTSVPDATAISSDKVGSNFDLVKKNINGYTFINNSSKDLAKKILLIYNKRKKIKKFKSNSLKIISKWEFSHCYKGLQKALHSIDL